MPDYLALFTSAVIFSCPVSVLRQQTPGPTGQAPVTVERLMSSEFAPKTLPRTLWLERGAAYTTLEPSAADRGWDIVRYATATEERRVLVKAAQLTPPGASAPLAIENYAWSPDRSKLLVYSDTRKVWRNKTRGDYWVLDLSTGALRQLGSGSEPATLMFATWSPDGTRIAYLRRDHGAAEMPTNLYVEEVATGRMAQLTHDAQLRRSDGSGAMVINGTGDWVNEEEFDIRHGFRWSPDGTQIAYWQFDATTVRDFNLINNTDSLYPVVIRIPYPKAGTQNSAVRVGVVGARGGETRWLDTPGDPSDTYIARIEWSPNGREIVLQHFDRLQQTLTLLAADPATGASRPLLVEKDSTWVRVVDDFQWLAGGREFLWVSERDGWRRPYVVSRDGRRQRGLTRGAFDVISITAVDEARGWLYFIASPGNATQRYLYRARLDGRGEPERVTPPTDSGIHSYEISPDAKWAFHTYSSFTKPPETNLVQLPEHTVRQRLVNNRALSEKFAPLSTGPAEFFTVFVRTRHGAATLDGRLIRPPGFDSTRKYPVLVHTYSEPAGQRVLDGWPTGREIRWSLYAASLGYVVVTVDNRGTPAPKGHAWRRVVYGAVGLLAADEQAAALRTLAAERPYLDTTRVAVWGWSGGGSMTLHLLFRYPELYQVGMSVAPVSAQWLYDTIYQERYMGTPQGNREGYRKGSPITYADGLRGKLLLVCATGDDNVHYQSCEVLLERLIELGKPVDFMAYPNRTHAFTEREGTVPHFYNLLTRYLTTNLPAGAR